MATEGALCEYFLERYRRSIPALYFLEETAKHLIVLSGENLGKMEVICPLESVVSMFSLRSQGRQSFPKGVLKALQPEYSDGLLCVLFRREDGEIARFCLSLGTAESCDTFLHSMRMLVKRARAIEVAAQVSTEVKAQRK
eukprot:CAMPEP_0169093682 /NCGR_PEP_ID=MMETSP1015-20121227/17567_1 /TAXON_ID=342587 /ORGANISM="Karlodinium micrum, Strain CCMP2283" /LENGTH=139 /DNA_ID=CAMNT_0009154339 /DNA_START=153 /DNA_END=572 /DNA_ORIENTATION=-